MKTNDQNPKGARGPFRHSGFGLCSSFGFRHSDFSGAHMLDLTTIATPTPVVPRTPVAIRVATMHDLPFLDALQKQHNKALGFFPRRSEERRVGRECGCECGGRGVT